MLKYAKITNEETKQCDVALGKFVPEGFTQMDVEQAWNNQWYLVGHCPEKPEPTYDEQKENRALAYQQEVDPITSHIQRLRDAEDPDQEKINELIAERDAKVLEIQERYPYPVEE